MQQITDQYKDVIVPLVSIELSASGKFRYCKQCGGVEAVLTQEKIFASGNGSHAGGFRCKECGYHLGWLTKSEVFLFKGGASW
jgi:hypothetical protein